MKRHNRKKNFRRIDNILEMPTEVYTNDPKITIVGFSEIVIENYKGILEYEDFFIRIKTFIGILNINGFNMTLEKMTDDDIKICGDIESIDIEKTVG